jgi:rubredoxin
MAIVVYLYNQVQRTAFAADEEMGERIAMMATSGSGKVAGEILITVEKPVGLTLEEKSPEGGVKVGFVNPLGNAGKAGIKPGDTVIYTSSFFGDELWPADKVTFTRSAITACPNAIDFVVMRGAAADQVNVKRLPKRPAPDKMQRKLTPQQKARATHICIDCGYIYSLAKPFAEQNKNYRCPQCQATKIRFAEYDAETGKTIGKGELPLGTISGVVFGIALVGGLAYLGLAL